MLSTSNLSALSRRRMLLGLASASATAAGADIAAADCRQESPALTALGDSLPVILQEFRAAKQGEREIVTHWMPRWPTAPVELLTHLGGEAEVDIEGRGIRRPDRRGEMHVERFLSAAEIQNSVASFDAEARRTKDPQKKARCTAARDEMTSLHEIAVRFETERDGVLAASGYAHAHKRHRTAVDALLSHVETTMQQTPGTMAGVVILALAVQAASELEKLDLWHRQAVSRVDWRAQLAGSILRIAQATGRHVEP